MRKEPLFRGQEIHAERVNLLFSRGEHFMKAIDRLSVIRHKSEINKNWKHTDLFRILRKNDIWIAAYENIKSNKGALTLGITKETLDGMSIEKLVRLRDKVVNESYQFKAVKEIEIPKPNVRKRPLGLPTANEKVVQEVIRMILEAVYEPCFSKQSFGFRQGLGTHDALEYIESKFRWVDWVIEKDIEGAYPTIDHTVLCNILSKKIQDVRFLNLIRKLLKCGILREGQFTRSRFGVPQGSIVSPILANIYFNELDEWVDEKAIMLNQPRTNQRHKKYKQLTYQIGKRTEQMQKLDKKSKEYKILLKELKTLKKEKSKVPSLATKEILIEYVRYADDWIIGIKGDQALAKELKAEVSDFMMVRLKQTIHHTKTKITDLRSGKAKFLGYEIYLPRNLKISPYTGSGTRTTRRTNPRLRFTIPMDSVLQRMEERGYIKNLVKGHRSISKASYTTLEDIAIIKHFAQVWRGLSNYYSGCTNLAKLQYIHYLLHLSCAMTLSHRHRLSTKKIFAKHGKTLTVSNGNISTSFPYRREWSITKKKWQNKQEFVDPF
jgi:group II intron reverse transcriptase/maturase